MIGRNFYQILRSIGMSFCSSGLMAGTLLFLYGYLVGNGMSAVRAIGMMFIFFFSQYMGRSYDMLNALGAMVIVLLWKNPFLLEYSGFWFSVMALIGVGFVGNTFSQVFTKETKSLKKDIGFWERVIPGHLNKMLMGISMSLGITLTTLPVVAYSYYEIPVYSPLVNAIVLPLLTPIFILALFGSVIGLFVPALAKIILMPCSWGLEFYIWICEQVGKLPFASIICGKPKIEIVVMYYVILACGVFMLQILYRRRKTLRTSNKQEIAVVKKIVLKESVLMFGIAICCLWMMIYPKDNPCEVTFLDVGQGDGVYISTGDDGMYFIDGGSTSEDCVGKYRILPFLKSKGIASIDYWFVSHADLDHISGLLEVMESGYHIEHLVVSKYVPRDENLQQLLNMAKECAVDVIYMDAGDVVQTNHTKIECLYPWSADTIDRNEASLVLGLEMNTYHMFFAGDISSEVEELLVEKGSVHDIWLYKASHHGSKYSNSEELLEILKPEITVISCAKNNFYGHPHKEVLDRLENIGSDIMQTQSGQVSFLLLK